MTSTNDLQRRYDRLRVHHDALLAALKDTTGFRFYRDGVAATLDVAESVRMHATWGPDATPNDGLKLGLDGVKDAVRKFARGIESGTAGRLRPPSLTPDGVIKERGEGCTWDDGITYGLRQLCAVLGVDPSKVRWDAATETVEGDVRSVIGNILRAWAADDWQDLPAIREMLLQGQGDDDGSQILPDFQEDMPVHAMVAECLHLLERRRDALDGYAATNGEAPTSPPDTLSSQESGVGETEGSKVIAWLERQIKTSHRDADNHPEGSGNRSFYRGQAIAYENALSLVQDAAPRPSQREG